MIESTYDHEKYRQAALKAWSTIRKNKIEKIKTETESLDDYIFNIDSRKISYGEFHINPPLIKHSKLTWVEKGGIGKELSDGWALNYAIGCTHACRFCYVDSIHKRLPVSVSMIACIASFKMSSRSLTYSSSSRLIDQFPFTFIHPRYF